MYLLEYPTKPNTVFDLYKILEGDLDLDLSAVTFFEYGTHVA